MDYSSYYPPQKRALSDEILADVLAEAQRGENGMIAAMQLLEEQSNLRSQDQAELNEWLARMQAEGSPRSAHALENYHRAQAGLETTEFVEAVPEPMPEPEPVFEAAPEPEPLVETEPEPMPLWASQFSTGGFDMIIAEEDVSNGEVGYEEISYEEYVAPDFSATNTSQFESILNEAKQEVVDEVADEMQQPEPVAQPSVLTTIERRSKPISQLWVWAGLSIGLGPILLAIFINSLGMSFVESLSSIAIGILVSSGLISIGALAGKRSGLQTLLLSRAAFGVHGNLFAAIPVVFVKIFWLVLIAIAGVAIFDGAIAGLQTAHTPAFAISTVEINYGGLAIAVFAVVASLLAFFGGKVLYRAQQISAVIALAASIGFVAVSASTINFNSVLAAPSAGGFAVISASTLVFTFIGSIWVAAGAEFARKLPMRVSGKRVILFTKLGAGVIPLIFATYSFAFVGSLANYQQRKLAEYPLITFLGLLPTWTSSALLVSGIISLLIWLASAFYSASVSLHSTGFKLRPAVNQPILIALVIAFTLPLTTLLDGNWLNQISGFIPFASVIVAAWAGIFVVDVALRRIAYHEVSLTRDYGFYKRFNWPNLVGFFLALALGFGFISNEQWSWLGYIATALNSSELAQTQIGIFAALIFAGLFPVAFGVKRIRAQEAEVLMIEARRNDLKDVFV